MKPGVVAFPKGKLQHLQSSIMGHRTRQIKPPSNEIPSGLAAPYGGLTHTICSVPEDGSGNIWCSSDALISLKYDLG